MADGVVVLDPLGHIAWANDAFARLVGHAVDELVGRSGLDLIHPDELERAADGILYASRFPGQTSVAPYRVRSGDGRWLDIELKSGTIQRDDGEHLILLVRDGTAHRATNRALQSVANGEALEQTVAILLEAVTWRWRNTGGAVVLQSHAGEPLVIASGLSSCLRDHALGSRVSADEWPSLASLASPGSVVVWDRKELPSSLADAAEAAGFEGCAVAQVPDPAGAPAHVIVWFEHTIIGRLEFTHVGTEILELLALALGRRHHLWQLEGLARHDSLTNLLNRAGLLDALDEAADQATLHDQALAVLYVDLDGLKAVNDQGGHSAGDQLLVEVAGRLRAAGGEEALVGRLGGDEFVLVRPVPASSTVRAAARAGAVGTVAVAQDEALAQQVAEALSLVVHMGGDGAAHGPDPAAVAVSASVGLAVQAIGEEPRQLLERADAAMYRAKAAARVPGRSRWSR